MDPCGQCGACLLIFIVSLVLSLLRDSENSDEQLAFVEGPTARPEAIAADGYVGSQKCQVCHEHEFGTWHDSFHRTMTQVASPTAIVGKFEEVSLERAGRPYQLGRDGDNFWVEFDDPDSNSDGSVTRRMRRKVVLCTGSHHMQVYWLSTGRGKELIDLPFVWLIAEQKWVPRESSFLLAPSSGDSLTPSRWNNSCITCHTTHGDRKLQPAGPPESTVAEFGIACEACHGPGESPRSPPQHHPETDTRTRPDCSPTAVIA